MSAPEGCPFCRCPDVRPFSDPSLELVGYRCHDCASTFYVTSIKEPREPVKETNMQRGGTRRRQPSP